METEDSELRILLVGKTGSGKSSTGNTIINYRVFKDMYSPGSVTMRSTVTFKDSVGKNIIVVDTPGSCHTSLTEDNVKEEIKKGLYLCAPGPHVILLVIRLDVRYTEEESKAVEWIRMNFGKEAQDCTMILFTYGDVLQKPIVNHLMDCPALERLVEEYNGLYHVFNNKQKDQFQVIELLNKIEQLREMNGNKIYPIQKKSIWFTAACTAGFGITAAAVGGFITAVVRK